MLDRIDEEYFQNQISSLYEDKEDVENTILKQYMLDSDKDIYIAHSDELDKEENIKCLKKVHTKVYGMDLYLYVVKVERETLTKKPKE